MQFCVVWKCIWKCFEQKFSFRYYDELLFVTDDSSDVCYLRISSAGSHSQTQRSVCSHLTVWSAEGTTVWDTKEHILPYYGNWLTKHWVKQMNRSAAIPNKHTCQPGLLQNEEPSDLKMGANLFACRLNFCGLKNAVTCENLRWTNDHVWSVQAV